MTDRQQMQQSRKKMGRQEISRLRAEYRTSHNPLWAWWAYRAAREVDLPCPAWVSAYFDRTAKSLLAHTFAPALPKKRAIARAIKKAFGFPVDARRKKANPFDLNDDELRIADCVYLHVVYHEKKLIYAYEFAAKKFGT